MCIALTVCAVAVRRLRALLMHPTAVQHQRRCRRRCNVPAALFRRKVSVVVSGCPAVPERALCVIEGEFARSGERDFMSLGVRGCSGRPYGPSTPIVND